MKTFMGINQWGQTQHDLGLHPRSELMRRLQRTSAAKMYRDKKDGPPVHVGYIVAGQWFTLYHVEPMERKA